MSLSFDLIADRERRKERARRIEAIVLEALNLIVLASAGVAIGALFFALFY